MCLTDWRRSGTAYDLAPLARQMPPAGHAQLKPLPPGVLERAFTLQPGGCRLTEVRRGAAALHAGRWRLHVPSMHLHGVPVAGRGDSL